MTGAAPPFTAGSRDLYPGQVPAFPQAYRTNSAASQPEEPATRALQALAAAMGNERQKALAALAEFPAPEDLNDLEALLAVGSTWFKLGAPETAIPFLHRAWEDDCRHPLVAARLGACLLAARQLPEALPMLERAVELMPESGGAWLNLARGYLAVGEAGKALAALDRTAPLAGKDESLYRFSRVEALFRLERHEEAESVLRQAFDRGDRGATTALVHLLGACGRHEEAWLLLMDALEDKPDETELMELAAELAQVRGRFGEAAHWLKRALEKEPDNARLWSCLAMLSSRHLGVNSAREAADTALALTEGVGGPLRAHALTANAHVLAEQDRRTEAEEAYRAALALPPRFAPALTGLGNLLMQQGHVEEATALYKSLKEIAPLQGWSQLIQARELPEETEVLEQLALAARRPSLEGPLQSHLLFTLAAAWEKKEDNDRAWQFAAEANRAVQEHLSYRPEQHRARVEREMARFSAAFMANRAGYGIRSRLPTFVLGMPRSGTTLVEQILGSHSKVFGAGELSLVPELIRTFNAWEMKLGTRRSYPECIDDMGKEESRRFAAKHLARLQGYAPTAERIVDKLPHNFEHIGLIKLLFPEAAILHLRREPRDVAVSNFFTDYACKFSGMGFAYDMAWIGEQLVDHQRLMDHWHRVFPGQILEVEYDALVEDVEGWARRIIDYLGLPWEDDVLSFRQLDRPVKTASVWQVRQPVYTTSKAKWKRYAEHLEPLESALADIPPLPDPLPLSRVPAGLFLDGMAHLQAGRFREAESSFRALAAARPAHAAAHHFLGAALFQQQKAVEARKAMRRSVELLPMHRQWLENLLAVEETLGNRREAEELAAMIAGRTDTGPHFPENGSDHLASGAT
ncbi:tetratricopeptide repeat-containing sulfotransferase family protein [Geotalea sp. SG265]|uniref:tetratricopeptide repeat-containing sulfotransferase family protein n=1 Tax=Geotalea sp. SG265 TaxID=2922867 RepID=UPI001FAF3BD3|nr:tetratricopeptide repeat-containing sulfotransferase family protein [Geotalea sp. SG265]